MSDPSGLVSFLAARLDEAEQNISYAGPARIAWLSINDDAGEFRYTTVAAGDDNSPWCADGRELPEPASVRVVWDPARELRSIAAKRAILAEHPVTGHGGHPMCDRCVNPYDPAGDELHRWVRYPCPTIRHLAAEWDNHPAYQPEWSPEPAGYDALKRSIATLEAQVAILMNIALGKGDTSINTARATLGLPAFASADETAPLSGKATEP